jgi:hypothetical protein
MFFLMLLISRGASGPDLYRCNELIDSPFTRFFADQALSPFECRVEREAARRKIIGSDVPTRFCSAMHAIHPDVFPFDRERAPIPDVVQSDDDILKPDITVADRSKIPVPPMIAKTGVTTEYTDFPGAVTPPNILHMRVIDSAFEFAQKPYVINALVAEMGRVVVESEPAMVFDRLQSSVGGGDIERDLSWMDFESEVYVDTVERIENWNEPLSEVVESLLNKLLARRWKGVTRMPYA